MHPILAVLMALILVTLLAVARLAWTASLDLRRDLRDLAADLARSHTVTRGDLQTILERLPTEPPKPTAEPWVGAFLPTDAHAAEIERQVRAAEDHAISAAGPVRYSSTRSQPSDPRSARAASTPRARSSGSK